VWREGPEGYPFRSAYTASMVRIAEIRVSTKPRAKNRRQRRLDAGITKPGSQTADPGVPAECGGSHDSEVNLEEELRKLQLVGDAGVSASRPPCAVSPVAGTPVVPCQEQCGTSLAGLVSEVFPVSSEMEERVRLLMERPDSTGVFETRGYEATVADLRSLDEGVWLNDAVIGGYMDLLQRRSESGNLPSVHAMDSYFYSVLVKRGPEHVRRASLGVDLFSFDLLVVPIHLSNHWVLTVVEMSTGRVATYDSLRGRSGECSATILHYLRHLHLEKKGRPLPKRFHCRDPVNVPQQSNSVDCGVFACRFAEAVTRRAPLDFETADMAHFRKVIRWELLHQQMIPPRDIVLELLGPMEEDSVDDADADERLLEEED